MRGSSRGVLRVPMLRRLLVVVALGAAILVPAASHSAPPPLRVTGATVEATGPDGADASYSVKAFDPDTGDALSASCDPPSGAGGSGEFSVSGHFPLGTTTVTCSTTTLAGDPVTASASVTVRDTTAPSVSAPGNVSVTTSDPSGAVVTYPDASATDIVDGSLPASCSPPSGSTFPAGTTTVTCSATDSHGNTGSASFTVTVSVTDTTPPVVSVPADIGTTSQSPGGTAVSFSASATDNLDGALTPSCSPPSGSTFPIGTTTVTCTATDTHGNSGSASFQVTVVLVDTTPPEISVPGNVSAQTSNPSGTAVSYSVSATDNLDGPVTPSCSPPSGSTFDVDTTTVTCTASDNHGNTAQKSFTVTVVLVDTTPPSLTVPSNISVQTQSPGGRTVSYSASATDNLDGAITPSCSPGSGSTFPVGTTTVTCTATDKHGNTAQKSFTVTVVLVDTTDPVLTVPGSFSVETPNPGGTAVTYTASATDNLDGAITPSCSPASGATFPVGATTVTCTATDKHGNKAQKSFTVTVVLIDVTPPVFSNVPAPIHREADGAGGSVVTYTAPTAVDAVDGPVLVTCAPASGKRFPLGKTTVTCSAVDAHGNSASAGFEVSVSDNTPPRVVLPPDSAVYATTDGGIPRDDAVVQAFLALGAASDLVDDHPTVSNDAPALLPVGANTITFTARDASGNSSRGSSVLTVRAKPPAGTPQLPPAQADRTPPDDVSGLKVKAGSGVIRLSWKKPKASDFDHVEITRSATTSGAPGTLVYRGNALLYVDRSVQNGTEYRYVVLSVDRAGNASDGLVAAATPKRLLLLAPPDGAKVKKAPRLTWVASASARFYNVQVFRGRTKILSAWPTATTLALHRTWKFNRRSYRLTRGTYRWYVWPGLGVRADARYGPLLGTSSFRVVR